MSYRPFNSLAPHVIFVDDEEGASVSDLEEQYAEWCAGQAEMDMEPSDD